MRVIALGPLTTDKSQSPAWEIGTPQHGVPRAFRIQKRCSLRPMKQEDMSSQKGYNVIPDIQLYIFSAQLTPLLFLQHMRVPLRQCARGLFYGAFGTYPSHLLQG